MTIKVYPSRLEGEPLETHEITREQTIAEWMAHATKGHYSPDAQDRHPTITLNGRPVPVEKWAEVRFGEADRLDVYIEPRGVIEIAALVLSLVSVVMALTQRPPGAQGAQSNNRRSGRAIGDASAEANRVRYGEPIPEIAGAPFTYPDYLAPPRRYYQNLTNLRTVMLLSVGVGEYSLSSSNVFIGDTPASLMPDDVQIRFYEPGEEIPAPYNEWWHSPVEVGFTSFGNAGIELSVASGGGGGGEWGAPMSWSGVRISNTLQSLPASWSIGARVVVDTRHNVTFGSNWIESPLLDTFEVEEGNRILITGANEGTYTIAEIIPATEDPEAPARYILAAALFPAGTFSSGILVERGGFWGAYTITDMGTISTTNYIDVRPITMTSWSGWPSAVGMSGSSVFLAESGEAELSWTGPYRVAPSQELIDRFEFDIFCPQGLVNYVDGLERQTSIVITAQWRAAGVPTWSAQEFTASAATPDQVGFTFGVTLPAPAEGVEVRLQRETRSSTPNIRNAAEWSGLRGRIVHEKTTYPEMTTMGVTFLRGNKMGAATENQIKVRPTRILPTIADPEESLPTRDIAPFFVYMMGTVGYGRNLIDMDHIAALHGIWSSREDTFDLAVASSTTLKTVANYCLAAGYAELTLRNGLITAARDAHRSGTPSRIYSPQELRAGGEIIESTATVMPDDIDGVDIEYIDYDTGKELTESYRLDGDAGMRVEVIKSPGVTNRTRAWRMAARHRRKLAYRRTMYKGGTELAAMNGYYMDYVGLQDGIPEFGQSAFVLDIDGNTLILSESILPITGSPIAILRYRDGTATAPIAITAIDGHSVTLAAVPSEVEVTADPNHPTVVYLGSTTQIMHEALITEVRPSGDGTVEFQAVVMDNRVYAEDDVDPFAPPPPPQVWIAAGASGHASRSIDDGATWSALPQGLNSGGNTSFNGLATDGTDGNGVWVAVASSGYASRSTDDGATWAALPQGLNSGSVTTSFQSVASDGNGVWVAVSSGGFASRSTDDGATWAALPQGLNSGSVSASFNSVATDGNGVWVAVASSGYASRSTDDGATWAALPQGLNSGSVTASFQSVASDGAGAWVAVASSGYASRSTDDGATWAALIKGLNSGNASASFNSVATDGNGVWVAVASSGYASRSTDDGATWVALERGLNSGSNANINKIITNGKGVWVAVTGANSPSSRSIDGGVTWTPVIPAPSNPPVFGGVASNNAGIWMAVATDGFAVKSIDNGVAWTALEKGLNSGSPTAWFVAVAYGNGAWVAVANDGYAARSTDNGTTWATLPQVLNSGSVVGLSNLATDGNGAWVAVAASGHASRSADNGATWSALPQMLNSGSAFATRMNVATDGNGVWVAVSSSGFASRSTDNGATWSALDRGLNSGANANFNSIATDGAGVWIAAGASGYASRSTDGGATWSALIKGLNSGSTTAQILAVAYGNGAWVAVAASGFASRSTDNGATWAPVALDAENLATNGSGSWMSIKKHGNAARSINNGADWSVIPQSVIVTQNINSVATTS